MTGKYFMGKIDDVRIWAVARSAAEIAAGYRSELTSSRAGLVANWRINEAGGNMPIDLVGTQDATLGGGARFVTDAHP